MSSISGTFNRAFNIMDKKTFGIGILSVTALLLFLAQFLIPARTAVAMDAVHDRDYQLVTSRVASGGEALYIVNKRGMVAVFDWDPNSRSVKLRAVRPLTDAFGQ
jgi:hypothetical protein